MEPPHKPSLLKKSHSNGFSIRLRFRQIYLIQTELGRDCTVFIKFIIAALAAAEVLYL